jgi:hypothetical protein
LYGFHQVRREVEIQDLLGKAVDPNGVECLGHVKENRASEPLLAKVPGNSFYEAGHLQGRAMSGSETKLLIPQHPTLAYFGYDSTE